MKYLVGNTVINSDHIVKVVYLESVPDDPDPHERKSACGILTDKDDESKSEWTLWLRGKEADRFWDAYAGDAYKVV